MNKVMYPEPTGHGVTSMVVGLSVEANDEMYANAKAGIPVEKNRDSKLDYRLTKTWLLSE